MASQKKALAQALEWKERSLFALKSRDSLHERLVQTAAETGRLIAELPIDCSVRAALVALLANPTFQDDLALWLSFWDLPQSSDARNRLEIQIGKRFRANGVADANAESFTAPFC